MIRPKHIIVTSNYHFKDICQNEEDVAAMERRFTVIHKYEPYIFKRKETEWNELSWLIPTRGFVC